MKINYLIIILLLIFNNLYSQTRLSSNYFEIGNWDNEKKEYDFYFRNGVDKTFFEIDKSLSRIIEKRGNVEMIYIINEVKKVDNESTLYSVSCESCNDHHKSTVDFVKILINLKNEFIGIYTVSDHTNLVRYRIDNVLQGK